MQRAAVVLLILLAVVGVAWLLFRDQTLAPPPPDRSVEAGRESAAPAVAAGAREAVPGPAPVTPADAAGDGPEAESSDPPATAPAVTVTLSVRSSVTQQPIAAFRVAFRDARPVVRVTGEDGAAGLALPPGTRGELSVEADGYLPVVASCQAPAAGAPPQHLDLFLDPAARATGITLAIRDLDGQPVTSVRAQALRLAGPADETAWAGAESLWIRRTSNAGGTYTLPELAPGSYGIRVHAASPDGTLLPLQPFVRAFALTGTNGFREDVVLEPGCLLTLELLDGDSAPLDPGAAPLAIDLRLPGGPAVSRLWHQIGERGSVAAADAPPGPGPCWLDEAIAPGPYNLTVRVGDRIALQQPLLLRAGERQIERFFVR